MKMDNMRFKTTQKNRSTTTMKKYPQVGKTGVGAVHESCPKKVYIMKKCNLKYICVMMTEI
jgi:hypothetical protein